MQELFNLLVGVAVLLCAWQIRKLWQKNECQDLKDTYTNERISRNRKDFDTFIKANKEDRKVMLEHIQDMEEGLDNLRTIFDTFFEGYGEDRKAIGECIAKMQDGLDEIKDSAIEKNLQEAKMFEGISNMMNYDVSTARGAVKGDA